MSKEIENKESHFSNLITEIEKRLNLKDPNVLELIHQAIKFSKKCNSPKMEMVSKLKLANYISYHQNDFKKGMKMFLKLLENKFLLSDINLHTQVLIHIGTIYNFWGQKENSYKVFIDAMTLLENCKDRDKEGDNQLGIVYFSFTNVINQTQLSVLFKKYINRAIAIFKKNGNKINLAKCYSSCCLYYSNKKDFKASLKYAKMPLKLVSLEENPSLYSIFLGNLGEQLVKQKLYEQAESMLLQSLELKQKYSQNRSIAYSFEQLGVLYFDQENFQKSIEYYKKSRSIFEQLEMPFESSKISLEIATCYSKLGSYKDAYQAQLVYSTNLEKQVNDAINSALVEAKFQFSKDQQELENKMLRTKNVEVASYNHKLEIQNAELKQFVQVASHDLKEPTRMMASYLGLLNNTIREKLTATEVEFFDFALEGSKRMHILLDDLLSLLMIQTTEVKVKVNANEVLTAVKANLAIQIAEHKAEINSISLPILNAAPAHLLLLFQNLIGNALKYNNNIPAKINISYSKEKLSYHFVIEDNGIGINEKFRTKIFDIFQRLHNRKNYSGTGIGLSICKKIIEHLNGEIWVEDAVLGGSAFHFRIPF